MEKEIKRIVATEAMEAAERALIAEFGDWADWKMILLVAIKAWSEAGYIVDERLI